MRGVIVLFTLINIILLPFHIITVGWIIGAGSEFWELAGALGLGLTIGEDDGKILGLAFLNLLNFILSFYIFKSSNSRSSFVKVVLIIIGILSFMGILGDIWAYIVLGAFENMDLRT